MMAATGGLETRSASNNCQCVRRVEGRLRRWVAELELLLPVHGSSLGLFRCFLGCNFLLQSFIWQHSLDAFAGSAVVFPYPRPFQLEWPTTTESYAGVASPGFATAFILSPPAARMVNTLLSLAAAMVAIGLCTRLAALAVLCSFGPLFATCQSMHNNHYVLLLWASVLLVCTDTGRWGSVDQILRHRRRDVQSDSSGAMVPRYHLLLWQFLWLLPYCGGALAKCNVDWLLRAEPPKSWFGQYAHRPGMGPMLLSSWWFPWAICWGGFIFDTVISLLLCHRKRLVRYKLGFPAAIFFNISNKLMFGIGVFPYAMMSSLCLFLPPAAPAAFFGRGDPATASVKPTASVTTRGDGRQRQKSAVPTRAEWFGLALSAGFVLLQLMLPIRHFLLYDGNPSWHEEGHFHSWHMKLRSKQGPVLLKLIAGPLAVPAAPMTPRIATQVGGLWLEHVPPVWQPQVTAQMQNESRSTGTVEAVVWVDPMEDPFLLDRQRAKMSWKGRPYMLLRYVSHLQDLARRGGRPLLRVEAWSCYSLNANAAQPLYIESANLLDYVDDYDSMFVTAIGRWIYPMADRGGRPPSHYVDVCTETDRIFGELRETSTPLASEAVFHSLYQAAGLRFEHKLGEYEYHDDLIVDVATGQLAFTERPLATSVKNND